MSGYEDLGVLYGDSSMTMGHIVVYLQKSNRLRYIIIKILLHYHQYFGTLSSRLGYNFGKILLHYREDFVTHSITIIKFVLPTFIQKVTVIVFF